MIITGKVIATFDENGVRGSRIRVNSLRYDGSFDQFDCEEVLPLGEEVVIHMDIRVSEEFESPEVPMADKEEK